MEEPWRWHSYYSVSSQSSSVVFQDTLQQQWLPVSTTTPKKADWFLANPLSLHSFSFSVSSGATLNHSRRLWQKKPRPAPCLVATVCVTMQPPITCPTTFRHQCEQKGRQKFAQCDLYSAGFHLLQTFRFCCFARQWIKWNAFQNARSPLGVGVFSSSFSFCSRRNGLASALSSHPPSCMQGVYGLKSHLCSKLEKKRRKTTEVTSSSITFQHDNTKRNAEDFNAVWI